MRFSINSPSGISQNAIAALLIESWCLYRTEFINLLIYLLILLLFDIIDLFQIQKQLGIFFSPTIIYIVQIVPVRKNFMSEFPWQPEPS